MFSVYILDSAMNLIAMSTSTKGATAPFHGNSAEWIVRGRIMVVRLVCRNSLRCYSPMLITRTQAAHNTTTINRGDRARLDK